MTGKLFEFAARLKARIETSGHDTFANDFPDWAVELFTLQFDENPAYRLLCEARKITPHALKQWESIPAAPTSAFKEANLTCLPAAACTDVFHSSGTTEHRPSRHFHNSESLTVYEASLWNWFRSRVLRPPAPNLSNVNLLILTPPPAQAHHSSLAYMFGEVCRRLAVTENSFAGTLGAAGDWALDFERIITSLSAATTQHKPLLILGTAFSFVHLLDHLEARKMSFILPETSIALETGGYKGRSRELPKAQLHALIAQRLGLPQHRIICEYGMSELSSQAYDSPAEQFRHFHFPPWARAQIISPETGLEVSEGEVGLIRVFDLANVFSTMAIQTEDLAIRRGSGFELIGRAPAAERRGCSLMTP